MITIEDFLKVDIHAGTIISAENFPLAKKPAYQLRIDFGDKIGIKSSSAQITSLYNKEELVGKQILAVTNFPARQIANFFSEVLVLGTVDENGAVTLIQTERMVNNGDKLA